MNLSQQLAISSSLSASFLLSVCFYLMLDPLSGRADATNPALIFLAFVWLCSLTVVLGTYFFIKKNSNLALVVNFLAGSFVVVVTLLGAALILIFGGFAYASMLIGTSLFSLVSMFLTVTDS